MFYHTCGSAYALWKKLNSKKTGLRQIQEYRKAIGLSYEPEYILESIYTIGSMDLLLNLAKMYPSIDLHRSAIQFVYKNGHFNIARWLHHHNVYIDEEITWACAFGHLRIAKWLYSIGCDPTVSDNVAIRSACWNGYLHVAKWLYSIGCDPKDCNNSAIRLACAGGHLNVINWLYSINAITGIDVSVPTAYTGLNKVSWLYNVKGIPYIIPGYTSKLGKMI